jgi:hypothetical protein
MPFKKVRNLYCYKIFAIIYFFMGMLYGNLYKNLKTKKPESSVEDPDPQDPHVFGPPGCNCQVGSGSGSFPFLK